MKLEKQRFHIHCFMRILPEIIKIESWGSKCFHIFMPNALQEACNSFTLLGLGAYVIIENNQCAILLFSFFFCQQNYSHPNFISFCVCSRPLFFYLHFPFLFSDSLNEGFAIEMNIIQKYWAQICPATIRSLECYRDSETMRKKINSLFSVEFFSTEILP